MKRILLSILGAGAAICGAASINPAARMALRMHSTEAAAQPKSHGDEQPPGPDPVIPVVVKLAEGTTVNDLPEEVSVVCSRANLAVAYVPLPLLDELGTNQGIVRLEASLTAMPTLDMARDVVGLPRIAAAEQLPMAFTGKGVVAGFCDVGFDPNHIAFIDEATGESRVKRLVNYTLDPLSPILRLDSPEEIAQYATDNVDIWHATHVAGILAGGYHGNPYYGVAPGTDIVATTSTLYEAQLLAGVESVIDYAKEVGKPAVVNISISSSTGPRDGTTLFNQYMEMAARDAAVCISVGNDGQKRGYLHRSFVGADPAPLESYFISHPSGAATAVSGYVSAWNDSSSPLSISLLLFDEYNKRLIASIPFEGTSPSGEALICSADVAERFGAEPSEVFSKYFSGYAWASWELNPENNRYNVLLHVDYTTESDPDFGAHNFMGFSLRGNDGDNVDVYASEAIYFGAINGAARGTTPQQVNDFCAAPGPICVGAYASRDLWPILSGESYRSTGTSPAPGVFIYNSYGDLPDGTHLPHICAPGSYLISAISEPYLEEHPERLWRTTTAVEAEGRTHHWIAECGTSMSSPFLAGVFALWLEADPTLTPDELLQIAIDTAQPPINNPADPRWGAGTVDAYAGLQAVIAKASVGNVAVDGPTLGPRPVFDIHGRHVADIDPTGALSHQLAPGLYIADGRKFLVR